MPFPAIPSQVKCPNCEHPFVVMMRSVLDVGEEPDLKEQFLRGEINRAECPNCGSGGILSSPLLYHDPEKELLISYMPQELGLPADQQEQLVGNLVNAVMNSMPAEKRKGYFFQPRTALTMESLYDAILEAEGVSKEALQAQRARMSLINRLLALVDDESDFDKLVEENRQSFSYEFFLMLSSLIDTEAEEGEEEGVSALRALREKLLDKVNPTLPSAAPPDASYDDIIEILQSTEKGEAWRRMIAMNRPRLDYSFFQNLTAKIEAAQRAGDNETVEELTSLRQRILDEIDAQSRMVREAEDEASLLIMELSDADDLEAAIREHSEEINDIFIAVLSRYRDTALARGNEARAEKMSAMLQIAREVMEEALPPDLRLISRLLSAEYPEGTQALLEEHGDLLSDALLKTYDRYASALERGGDEEATQHLKNVREQIAARMADQA